MIIEEVVTIKDIKLKHIYSSENKNIKQIETGIIYDQVYDTFKRNYHYVETDEKLDTDDIPDVPQQ